MTVRELYEKMNRRIPPELSCDWDNDGLMVCPDDAKEVRKVLITLDVTANIAEEAIRGDYDLIVSHHPLIFHLLPALEPSDPIAKKTIRLLKNGISVMSFHTRLDAVEGGVNDTLADLLGLTDVQPFGEEKIGRIGRLSSAVSLAEFAEQVKKVTGISHLTVSDAGLPVQKIALLGGAGSDDVSAAKAAGADTYLSGEISYHHLTDAPERGMNLIAAGHFHTEQPVCETLRKMLTDIDGTLSLTVTDSCRIQIL